MLQVLHYTFPEVSHHIWVFKNLWFLRVGIPNEDDPGSQPPSLGSADNASSLPLIRHWSRTSPRTVARLQRGPFGTRTRSRHSHRWLSGIFEEGYCFLSFFVLYVSFFLTQVCHCLTTFLSLYNHILVKLLRIHVKCHLFSPFLFCRPWVMSPCMFRRIPRRRAVRTRLTLPGLSASHHGASGALGGGLDRTTSPTRGLIEPGASASGTGAVIGPLPTPPPDQGDSEEQPRDIVRIISGNQYGAHTRTVSTVGCTLFSLFSVVTQTICSDRAFFMYLPISSFFFLVLWLASFEGFVGEIDMKKRWSFWMELLKH